MSAEGQARGMYNCPGNLCVGRPVLVSGPIGPSGGIPSTITTTQATPGNQLHPLESTLASHLETIRKIHLAE